MSQHQLLDVLKRDYQNLRELEDGTIVGTVDLLYTRALVIGLDAYSWDRRYCYADRGLATQACAALTHGDAEPLPGYVALRMSGGAS